MSAFGGTACKALGLYPRHRTDRATCANSTEITRTSGPAKRRQLPTAVTPRLYVGRSARGALAILKRQPPRNASNLLFGERGFNVFGRAKQELDQRLHIAPWRLHDLRRTCATQMAELGVQPWYVEAVLNHQSGHKQGVAGTYNRARYADEMRSALQRWADYVDKITSE